MTLSTDEILQRDLTVQAIVSLDVAAQDALGTPGVIVGQGKAWQLFVEVTHAASDSVRAKLWWDSIGGSHAESAGGGHFVAPDGFFILTATRFWKSDSEVRVRYYANDQLLVERTSSVGDIDGDVSRVTVGYRDDGVGGSEYFLEGDIDQIKVTDYEMTAEEVRQTYRRIAIHQPLGGDIVRASVPSGGAWSSDPDSAVQRELAVEGDALGWMMAKMQELREDFSPARAWSVLEDWERITGLPPKLLDTVEVRRNRVLSFLRKVHGFHADGVAEALAAAFDLDAEDVEILEYSNRWSDDFATAIADFWQVIDSGGSASVSSGEVSIVLDSGEDGRWIPGSGGSGPTRLDHAVDGDPRDGDDQYDGIDLTVKIATGTLQQGAHAGIAVYDGANRGDALWIGRYNNSGTEKLGYRRISDGVLGSFTALEDPTADDRWVRIRHDGDGSYTVWWSDTGPDDVSNETGSVAGPASPSSCCLAHLQEVASNPGVSGMTFDEWRAYFPNGLRVFNWYAYRDPALSGTPDMPGARTVVDRIKPAHTDASAVRAESCECDDDPTA